MTSETCTGRCLPGYYCESGEFSHSPPGKECTPGNYCPVGSISMQACPAGTYQPNNFASSCIECPAGFYCEEGESTPQPCQVGHYCPQRTGDLNGIPCDPGFYQPNTEATYCLKCDPGMACTTSGKATIDTSTDMCDKGYRCKE